MEAIPNKRWKPEGEAETRYRRARQEWDRRMGAAVVQARSWRLATILALGLVGLSLIGTIYLGTLPKVVPHIVQIDRLGAPAYLGPVGQAARDWKPAEAAIKYHLRRFVTDTRTISSDLTVMKRAWTDAYALITPSAANRLNAYAQESNPMKRADTERVTVDIASVVQLSAESWQADWIEKTWDKEGSPGASSVWRGTFRVVVHLPDTEEALAANPIGLFVDEFHWSKVQD